MKLPNMRNWLKIDGIIKEIREIINIKNPPIFGSDKLAHSVKHKLYIHTEKNEEKLWVLIEPLLRTSEFCKAWPGRVSWMPTVRAVRWGSKDGVVICVAQLNAYFSPAGQCSTWSSTKKVNVKPNEICNAYHPIYRYIQTQCLYTSICCFAQYFDLLSLVASLWIQSQ